MGSTGTLGTLEGGSSRLRHYLQCLAMKIVGLVGHIGAGKTSIAKFLESTGYLRITLSDFLIQEARAREVAPTRVNLQHLGDELRRRNGGSVLFKRALKMANQVKADRVVIDGIRNPDEVRALKDEQGAILIGVTRSQWQGSTQDAAASSRERNPNEPAWGQRVAESISMADLMVENAGTLDELCLKVSDLLLRQAPTAATS